MSSGLKWMVATAASSAFGVMVGLAMAPHVGLTSAQAGGETLIGQQLEIQDAAGHRRILMGTSGEGSPGIWLFDANGKARLNLGLYGDNNAMVVLNDENEQAVEILRTVGGNSAPVLVQKTNGQDKVVAGLNFNGDMEPFLVHYDRNGSKRTEYGTY